MLAYQKIVGEADDKEKKATVSLEWTAALVDTCIATTTILSMTMKQKKLVGSGPQRSTK
jgi:hypothetical protein